MITESEFDCHYKLVKSSPSQLKKKELVKSESKSSFNQTRAIHFVAVKSYASIATFVLCPIGLCILQSLSAFFFYLIDYQFTSFFFLKKFKRMIETQKPLNSLKNNICYLRFILVIIKVSFTVFRRELLLTLSVD